MIATEATDKSSGVSTFIASASALSGFVLLVTFIHRNGFWIDELYTLHTIHLPLNEMIIERLQRGHFPGYFLLIRAWHRIFPNANLETVLRSFSILCWAASVASYWLFAKRFLPAASAGIALTLLALNTMAIRQADEVRMYTLTLLIGIWILRAYLELSSTEFARPTRRWKLALVAGTVAGFAVSASIAFLALSLLFDAWRGRKEKPQRFRICIWSVAASICVFVPGAIMHLGLREQIGVANTEPLLYFVHLVTLFAGIQSNDRYYAPTWLLIGLVVTGAAITAWVWLNLLRRRSELPDLVTRCVRIVALPLAIIPLSIPASEWIGFSLLGPPRYLISLLPAAALLSGYAIGQALQSKPPRIRLAAHAALATFLLVGDVGMLTVRTERFREQVAYLDQRWKPGDGVILTAHEIEEGVEYYAPRITVDAAISRMIMSKDELRRRIEPLSDRPNVWIVWYRGRESPLLEVAQEMWGPYESSSKNKPMGSLRVFRFSPGTTTTGTIVISHPATP
jgi:hypothetical protein